MPSFFIPIVFMNVHFYGQLMDRSLIDTLAVHIVSCKQCNMDCSRCAKYPVMTEVLGSLAPAEQLMLDINVRRLEARLMSNSASSKDRSWILPLVLGIAAGLVLVLLLSN